MFKRIVDQYSTLARRGAFLREYQAEAMFADNLDEFDDAKSASFMIRPLRQLKDFCDCLAGKSRSTSSTSTRPANKPTTS